ncbi:hypothetical protein DIPPA_25522 [Diplonema papillatum]|nr:hypothetical protein DIPPA_25522 [Diplonema papillatum]
MTPLATAMACLTFCRPATASTLFMVPPSITMASSVFFPKLSGTPPYPTVESHCNAVSHRDALRKQPEAQRLPLQINAQWSVSTPSRGTLVCLHVF